MVRFIDDFFFLLCARMHEAGLSNHKYNKYTAIKTNLLYTFSCGQ